jgi:hypothetical protein
MAHSEIGVWRLVEARARDAEGRPVPSQFGPTPLGVVTFDGRRMIAALGDARDEVPEEERPRQYNSYAGPYSFDGATLVTRVDCASSPDRMGTDQVRGVRFEEGGRRMVLTPPPRMIRGVMHHPELVWERMG